MRASIAAVVCAALLGVACSSSGEAEAAARVAAIVEARAEYGPVAERLGEAAILVEEGLRGARLAASVEDRQRWTSWTADATLELAAAAEELDTLLEAAPTEVPTEGPESDVAAALRELAAARSAAVSLGEQADVSTAAIATVTEADTALAGIAAAWDEPGSRSQQLDRLAARRDEAQALADQLRSSGATDPCGLVERRLAAAEAAATHSEELRALVAAQRGNDFDARRAALRDDPFGLGVREVADLDPADEACLGPEWPGGAAEVMSALVAFTEALDPADLGAQALHVAG